MFENSIVVLDWLGIVAFSVTGALVASRNQMDAMGFVLLGTVTGLGGGTVRDLLLQAHPIFWIEHPQYLAICIFVSLIVYLIAHWIRIGTRHILWGDAIGLALYATVGAERATTFGASTMIAVVMGMITASFGGIIRDLLGHQRSIIFSDEIYVTAAMGAASVFLCLQQFGFSREIAISAGVATGFVLRAGALLWGWSLPRFGSPPSDRG